MSSNGRISIITVAFNSAKTIERTILSVIGQKYPDTEYIIIDGGSNDGTIDIIKKYESQIAYWVSEKDKGIYDAMNKGLLKATGKWIGIINSDDWYEAGAFEKVMAYAAEHKGTDVIYGNLRILNGEKEVKVERKSGDISLLKQTMIVAHPTVFAKRTMYERWGHFQPEYRICGDWDLMRRFYLNGANWGYIDDILVNFSMGGASNGFSLNQLKERRTIRHSQKKYAVFYYDLKDILIYFYFKIRKKQ